MENLVGIIVGFVLTTVAGGWWAAKLQVALLGEAERRSAPRVGERTSRHGMPAVDVPSRSSPLPHAAPPLGRHHNALRRRAHTLNSSDGDKNTWTCCSRGMTA